VRPLTTGHALAGGEASAKQSRCKGGAAQGGVPSRQGGEAPESDKRSALAFCRGPQAWRLSVLEQRAFTCGHEVAYLCSEAVKERRAADPKASGANEVKAVIGATVGRSSRAAVICLAIIPVRGREPLIENLIRGWSGRRNPGSSSLDGSQERSWPDVHYVLQRIRRVLSGGWSGCLYHCFM
jgi:hypothetical protein